MKIGIDFGTTNSAVAIRGDDGKARILELSPGERVQRTVIYGSPEGRVSFGNAAFREYLDSGLDGRFLRSIKAFLPQDVPRTALCGKMYTFPELITAYLRFLMGRVEALLDQPVSHVTVGRPVRFHADAERDALAAERLTQAVAAAGIGAFTLQLEPIGAAWRYEQDLQRERVVLVGDFGGGTSDFAVIRVGPGRTGDRSRDVLATSGVAKAGDVLDGRFLDVFLLDQLGRGLTITPRYGVEPAPWEHSILRDVQRLYYLHLLRSPELDRQLAYVERHVDRPQAIRRLRRLVFDDLGYPMAWAVEAAKRGLSAADQVAFVFDAFHHPELNLACPVERGAFASGCSEVLDEYRAAIDEALTGAGLTTAGIHEVFLTGGTAQLPFVRDVFVDRFGADAIREADAFTSVCEGLALAEA